MNTQKSNSESMNATQKVNPQLITSRKSPTLWVPPTTSTLATSKLSTTPTKVIVNCYLTLRSHFLSWVVSYGTCISAYFLLFSFKRFFLRNSDVTLDHIFEGLIIICRIFSYCNFIKKMIEKPHLQMFIRFFQKLDKTRYEFL